MGQLKQVVAAVIVVILLVLFLRVALQTFHEPVELGWRQIATIALLPFGIALLALALRLLELDPKPGARAETPATDESPRPGERDAG